MTRQATLEELRRRGTYRADRHGTREGGKVPPPPPAPRHLSPPARQLWRATVAEWHLDPAALAVLRIGLEAFDQYHEALALVRQQGLVLRSPRGAVRPHPALRVVREARAGFLTAFKALGVEVTS